MKKISLSLITALFFFVAAAVAQSSPSGASNSQGTTGSSPAMNGQTGSQGSTSPGMDQSGTQSGMSDHQSSNSDMKGEKKLKGCVESQGGQYMLATKKGKTVALSGQDVSAHVGHEVAVHGSWGPSSMSSTSAGTSSSASAESGQTFNVTSVDMISDSCGGKNKSDTSTSK
ncbi:MAG TPA: hypothetical protein VFA74_11865 [Terriglobales bacterium]|nr:hypothetical protein [Terriglobales bacterium]